MWISGIPPRPTRSRAYVAPDKAAGDPGATAMRDRMPGRYATPWCPTCHRAAGRDCPTRTETPRQVRRRLKRQLDRELVDHPEETP